jgi:tetratricopeptide (TPR) repeat protein
LAAGHPVALVSYDDDADQSDLALLSKARRHGFDYILRGEILPDRRPRSIAEAGRQLTVSWRLLPVDPQLQAAESDRAGGMPIVVNLDDALQRYPDLALVDDDEAALHAAVIRDTLPLIVPSVQRTRVQLEIPYLLPGARRIRRGNAYARAGRWAEAEAHWRQALERFPFSSVAVHNLAIAAVAKQDYRTARQLARKAVRMKPTRLHQRTLVWVEQMQRAYHQAFDLPDPPEGWLVTRSLGQF